jgi:hypothetical protein
MYDRFEKVSDIKISKEEYIEICKEANSEIFKMIIHKGYQLNLKKSLGVVFIRKIYKPNYQRLDYKHYKETGEKVFLPNFRTDGYIYQTNWLRWLPHPNIKGYFFSFTKENRTYIKNAILDNTINITQRYKTPKRARKDDL